MIHSSTVVFNPLVCKCIFHSILLFILINAATYKNTNYYICIASYCKFYFYFSRSIVPEAKKDPCVPTPCGPNSQCRNIEEHAVCSCLQGYLGSPPSCRPECLVSAECPSTRACVNKKCTDPCLGSCGLNARCEVINHSPICSCLSGQTGDPFRSCYDIPSKKN